MLEVAFVFISVLAHVQSSFDFSSFVKTVNNHKLSGCVIKSQRTSGILECAHRCLMHDTCDSFNYVIAAVNQGTCELNRHSEGDLYAQNLIHRDGCVFGKLMNPEAFIFTTLGAVGREGPKNTSGYLGTSLEGKVKLNGGIQIWDVPQTGRYEIEAWGASGGDGKNSTAPSFLTFGGLGARVLGQFYLRKGTQLKILVGQRGITLLVFEHRPGTGGGGSFVTTMNDTALIVAGGGGGGCVVAGGEDGDSGQGGRNGSQNGGVQGLGGKLLIKDGVTFLAGAGGGFFEDGEMSMVPPMDEAQSFTNGGKGGASYTAEPGKTDGGFGGGGGSVADPGGGGGYSGGGVTKTKNFCKAGGGGSYNSGTQQLNEAGFNKGDGQVSIRVVN